MESRAITSLARVILISPRRVDPTGPVKKMSPVPDISARSWPPAPEPSIVLSKLMSPATNEPVLTDTSPVNVVAEL